MEQKANDFLEKQPVGELMRRYAVPCVISLLVALQFHTQLVVGWRFILRLADLAVKEADT